jgi:hypothetical protein
MVLLRLLYYLYCTCISIVLPETHSFLPDTAPLSRTQTTIKTKKTALGDRRGVVLHDIGSLGAVRK